MPMATRFHFRHPTPTAAPPLVWLVPAHPVDIHVVTVNEILFQAVSRSHRHGSGARATHMR